MVSFGVSDVAVGSLLAALPRERSVHSLLGARVEAIATSDRRLVACTSEHALARAAHDAFFAHLPLVLTPDAIWLTLAQGFAHHVNLHLEALRDRFVRHQGKATLEVEHLGIVLGQPSPWPEVFAAFSDQLAGVLGKTRDLVVADFSTTGPLERAASEIVLMDAFQGYFEYVFSIGCGIPSITLRGTPDDWRAIRRRAQVFSEYGLGWWTDELLPVLDAIAATAAGSIDADFWRSCFRYDSHSGGDELTGWIVTLFPYLFDSIWDDKRLVRNPHLAGWQAAYRDAGTHDLLRGPGLAQLPSSLSSVPATCVDVRDGTRTALRFVAGLVGVAQDEATRAVEPEFGWAVVYA